MPERDYLDPNGASVRNAPVVATNEATSLLSRGLRLSVDGVTGASAPQSHQLLRPEVPKSFLAFPNG